MSSAAATIGVRNAPSAASVWPALRTWSGRCWDALLALGLLFALETQLRADITIVGPGELCLTIWVLPLLFLLIFKIGRRAPLPFWEVARFWLIFAAALCIGSITAMVTGDLHDPIWADHDIMAYSLLAALTCAMTFFRRAGFDMERAEFNLVLFGTISLALQGLNALNVITIPNVDPWYWDRLRGWCDNPDQYAMLCLLLALLPLHVLENSRDRKRKAVALCCIALALPLGWAAKSNAYAMVILFAAALFFGAKILRWARATERRGRPGFAVLAAAAIALTLMILVPVLSSGTDRLSEAVAGDLLRNKKTANSELDLRVFLWKEALRRGSDVWFLGLGPGPHLAIPGVIVDGRRDSNEPANLQHPVPKLAPNFEAHNTLLELFVQGGALADADFLLIVAIALIRTWRNKQDGLATLLLSLGFFGCFHVIFRHPIVWFVILIALTSTTAADPRAAERNKTRSGASRPLQSAWGI